MPIPRRRRAVPTLLQASLFLLALVGRALPGQYVLRPTPVIDPGPLGVVPSLSGFVIVQHGQRGDSGATLVRGARLTAQARPLRYMAVKLQAGYGNEARPGADTTSPVFGITDANVQFFLDPKRPRAISPTVVLGQFKVPFSLEYLTSVTRLPATSRSQAVDRLSPRRDIGGMVEVDAWHHAVLDATVVNGTGSNANPSASGQQLAAARLTLLPIGSVALAGKVADRGSDHAWGYDGRWLTSRTLLEFEVLHRRRPRADGSHTDASGGFVTAAYKVTSWFEPVAKWEQYLQHRPTDVRSTWGSVGVNLSTPHQVLRGQLFRVAKTDEPDGRRTAVYFAQVIANF